MSVVPLSRRAAAAWVVVVLALVSAVHFTAIPLTIWEYDESLFAMAVESYEPLLHHPPPPGYPLYIGFAKLLAPLFGAPFPTLLAVSALSTFLGCLAFALAFGAISGSMRTGALGALLFYVSPVMLVHATLPQSDAGALALLGLSLWLLTRAIEQPSPRLAALAGVVCAVTVGWRLQFSIAVVPMLLAGVLLLKGWRLRLTTLSCFGVVCVAWLVPLVVFTGGPSSFWQWLSGQAAYFAEHDADLSRGGRGPASIALRFISHPWGPKWLAGPVLLLAVVGFAEGIRRRRRVLLPVGTMIVAYYAFALRMMDPADGVRYALPAVAGVALLAILGVESVRRWSRGSAGDWLLVALYGIGAYVYCGSLLRQRAEIASPPVAAARYLRSVAPANAIILHDMALKPHVSYLLRGYRSMRINEGLLRYGHRADLPIFEIADGAVDAAGARVFRWKTGDPYQKLTRNHYGATSVVPLLPSRRFLAVEGVSPPERAVIGSWRWISDRGVIELPALGATHVRLTFANPVDYPFERNSIEIRSDDRPPVRVRVLRGATVPLEVEVSPGAPTRIVLTPERSFVPAQQPGTRSRDTRRLSIMLVGVEQLRR